MTDIEVNPTSRNISVNLPLLRAIRNLGITPFLDSSVEEYKAEKLAECRKVEPKHWFIRLFARLMSFSRWVNEIVGAASVVGIVLGAIAAASELLPTFVLLLSGNFSSISMPFVSILLTFLCVGMCTLMIHCEDMRIARWRVIGLNKIDLPREVQKVVHELRVEFRGVEFEVHELHYDVAKDPLIRAKLNGEKYYFAVWDEENFVIP